MSLRSAVLALVLAAGSAAGCSTDPPLDTVPSLDLNKLQGQWFEIAHLPRPTQADCTATTATYTITGPTSMTLVHQCYLGGPSGALKQVAANAVVKDTSAPAKLAVDFGGFYGDYWVIDLGAQYEYAVVGHPSRDYLWILSRTPTLEQATLDDVRKRAADKGFDVSRLEYTKQDGVTPPPPHGDDVKAKTYGCGVGPAAPSSFGLAAVAALALLARRRRAAKSS